jgi:malonate-semialdehyde dehydrogenase (acetylating)/methylmalonate-semialdehyde dehydrogenase
VRTIQHWIGGKVTSGSSSRRSPVYNPATGEVQADVVLATKDDLNDAVDVAATAFEEWSQSSLSKRTKVLFAFRELVNSHMDELAPSSSRPSTARSCLDARGEVQRGLEVVEFACGIPSLLKGEYSDQASTGVTSSPSGSRGRRRRHHAVQLPDHGPDVDAPRSRSPCGNTFILKPSERDPSVSQRIAGALRRGRPAGRGLQRRQRRQGGRRRAAGLPGVARCPSSGRRRSRATSTSAARRTASGSRRSAGAKNHAIVLPGRRRRLRLRPPRRRCLRLGRRAVHGDLGRGRRSAGGEDLVAAVREKAGRSGSAGPDAEQRDGSRSSHGRPDRSSDDRSGAAGRVGGRRRRGSSPGHEDGLLRRPDGDRPGDDMDGLPRGDFRTMLCVLRTAP